MGIEDDRRIAIGFLEEAVINSRCSKVGHGPTGLKLATEITEALRLAKEVGLEEDIIAKIYTTCLANLPRK